MILETLRSFYGNLSGRSTDEVYEEYCKQCMEAGIEPKMKSIVVRELCVISDCKTKRVQKKYFVSKGGG